ncbi:AraC family transcriptional regulator ligand-binding domain-containing protein [Rheinheimera sediminis]|uniref:AraC family transcriptional regulator ligand-binding domain-containing protein n=1 Tax=Rheinheimera sp. YQF-1 TaxID=2499626 RepID=UPI001643FBA7|nr:AraC family transcriptional regulator ligand-binding domain-containing protein [Rheinheimera sp. YQF-1]
MSTELLARQERISITPQILFHTFHELQHRGLPIRQDPLWKIFNADGFLPGRDRLTFLQSQQLLLRATELAADPDLGLAVGMRQPFASMGLVASAMLASANLRQAISTAGKYHRITGSMIEFEAVALAGSDLRIMIRPRFIDSPVRRFVMQEALAVIMTSLNFIKTNLHPVLQVTTPYKPKDAKRLQLLCNCPVLFEQPELSITFSGKVLDQPNIQSDPFVYAEVITVLDQVLKTEVADRDLLQWVESRIIRTMPQIENIEATARALGLSERSLRRKLAELGTSYRQVLQQVRLALALQLQAEGSVSREQIAYEIGFEDARSLRRLLKQEKPTAN